MLCFSHSCCFYLSALLAEAIYTNSTHQRVCGIVNTEKRRSFSIGFSGVDGKAHAF